MNEKTVGIIGHGHRALRAAQALLRGEHIATIVLVESPWPSATRAPIHNLLRSHAPAGPTTARTGTLEDLADAAVVVLAWDPMPPTGDPQASPAMPDSPPSLSDLRSLVETLNTQAPDAILVIATGPMDPLTTIVTELSQRPSSRVLGTGTLPNTLHFRTLLADHYRVHPDSVYLLVLGAHGLHGVPVWSQALIGGHRLVREELFGMPFDADRLWHLFHTGEDQVHRAGPPDADGPAASAPSETQGRSRAAHAVACAVRQVVDAVLLDQRQVLPVSTLLEGTFGIDDVCLSLPCVIGKAGVEAHTIPHLADDEEDALNAAAQAVREALDAFAMNHAPDVPPPDA